MGRSYDRRTALCGRGERLIAARERDTRPECDDQLPGKVPLTVRRLRGTAGGARPAGEGKREQDGQAGERPDA